MKGITERDFQKIAHEHNTTIDEVKREIAFAVKFAQIIAPHMWENYQGTTCEEAIEYIKQFLPVSVSK